MTELLLRMLCGATFGLALVLLLRRPTRRVSGAGAAFALWLLPLVLALAPLLPAQVVLPAMIVVPGWTVTPHLAASTVAQPAAIDWTQALLAIWIVGVAGALLRLVMHYVRLLRGLRRAPQAWADAARSRAGFRCKTGARARRGTGGAVGTAAIVDPVARSFRGALRQCGDARTGAAS